MAGMLSYGAGAGEGLETLMTRLMDQEKLRQSQEQVTETGRSHRATEDYQNRALTETSALRKLQAESLNQDRANRDADRTQDNIRSRIALRPIGSKVSAPEFEEETNVGKMPSALYKQTARAPEGDEYGPQQDVTFGGTQAQLTSQERIDQANERAAELQHRNDVLESQGDTRLGQGAERVKQGQERNDWGPPTITIGDPEAPTGASVIRKTQLPAKGAPAAPPGAIRTQEVSNDVGLAQLDRLEEMFKGRAGQMTGPAEGRLRGFGQKIPGVPVDTDFSDFEAATSSFRNAVIKAITGAQMSEPEANRIRQQIPEVTDKREVWLSKAKQTRKNLGDLQRILGGSPKAPGGGGSADDPLGLGIGKKKK